MSNPQASISLIALGDLAFNARYHQLLDRHGPEYPLQDVQPLWQSADLRLGNLESPLTVEPRATPIKLTLRGSLRTPETLNFAGIDCVSLANNHMMDFGPSGLLETCARLDDAGIAHVGAGENEHEASEPAELESNGSKVGVLAYCDVQQISQLYAAAGQAGVSRLQLERCLADVRNIRDHVDWLVVQLHWGVEMSRLPTPEQRNLARQLVDAGVDCILGHHPHVVQPCESIDGVPVAYSLGDFTFSSTYWQGTKPDSDFLGLFCVSPLSRETGWLKVRLSNDEEASSEFQPAYLGRDLVVREDNSATRRESWHALCRRLALPEYEQEVASENKLAKSRDLWRQNGKKLTRRIQLKLLQWGCLPGTYVEPIGLGWRDCYTK